MPLSLRRRKRARAGPNPASSEDYSLYSSGGMPNSALQDGAFNCFMFASAVECLPPKSASKRPLIEMFSFGDSYDDVNVEHKREAAAGSNALRATATKSLKRDIEPDAEIISPCDSQNELTTSGADLILSGCTFTHKEQCEIKELRELLHKERTAAELARTAAYYAKERYEKLLREQRDELLREINALNQQLFTFQLQTQNQLQAPADKSPSNNFIKISATDALDDRRHRAGGGYAAWSHQVTTSSETRTAPVPCPTLSAPGTLPDLIAVAPTVFSVPHPTLIPTPQVHSSSLSAGTPTLPKSVVYSRYPVPSAFNSELDGDHPFKLC